MRASLTSAGRSCCNQCPAPGTHLQRMQVGQVFAHPGQRVVGISRNEIVLARKVQRWLFNDGADEWREYGW